MSRSSGCVNRVQDLAIRENSASKDQGDESAPLYLAALPPDFWKPIVNPELQLRLDTSGIFSNSYARPTPLRI
jgi:hypothetical protein